MPSSLDDIRSYSARVVLDLRLTLPFLHGPRWTIDATVDHERERFGSSAVT
jgi:hypothetical protein